jgi:nucleoside-diphosphate-sugar epimerase
VIVALTGGTGFLGRHVLTQLRSAGYRVQALARRPQEPVDGVAWTPGTLDDADALHALLSGTAAVVHIAGVVNAPDPATFDRGNRLGTIALLHAAPTAGVRRFVHISSLAAREPALSVYGASKRAAEDAVAASPLDTRIVRPPAIYGPGDTDNLELFRLARRGVVPLPPGGRLSVIHAEDMARLIVALVAADHAPALCEADDAMPGGWSHVDFARAIGAAVGRRPLVVPLPAPLVRLGAALDGRLRGPAAKLTPDRARYFCHPDWVIDPTKRPPPALWTPRIATAAGLAATAAWYRTAGWL